MPQRISNTDRIERAAAEVTAKDAEKAAKKEAAAKARAAKPRKPRAPRAPKAPPRMKIVWAVGVPGAEPAATFPYAARAEADADCARRGKTCVVKPARVAMEAAE